VATDWCKRIAYPASASKRGFSEFKLEFNAGKFDNFLKLFLKIQNSPAGLFMMVLIPPANTVLIPDTGRYGRPKVPPLNIHKKPAFTYTRNFMLKV
jgi:hypothetical protein